MVESSRGMKIYYSEDGSPVGEAPGNGITVEKDTYCGAKRLTGGGSGGIEKEYRGDSEGNGGSLGAGRRG